MPESATDWGDVAVDESPETWGDSPVEEPSTPSLQPVTDASQLSSRKPSMPFPVARQQRMDPAYRLPAAWEQLPQPAKERAAAEALSAFEQEPLINLPRIETAPDANPLKQIGAGAYNVAAGVLGGVTTG